MLELVQQIKDILTARGVSLSGSCGAFAITQRVAWSRRFDGWRLIAKPSGDNCMGFSADKLVNVSSGLLADILFDAGGANVPQFSPRPATPEELAVARDPFDPGDVPGGTWPLPQLPPEQPAPPPQLPALDVDALAVRLGRDVEAVAERLYQQHERIYADLVNRLDALSAQMGGRQ